MKAPVRPTPALQREKKGGKIKLLNNFRVKKRPNFSQNMIHMMSLNSEVCNGTRKIVLAKELFRNHQKILTINENKLNLCKSNLKCLAILFDTKENSP